MLFTHDTEVALAAATALVNTDGEQELLPDVAALDAFVTTWAWTGRHDHGDEELAAVRALRPRLRGIWNADEDEAAAIVNGLLSESRALPQLVKHDEWNYHLHATPSGAPLAVRMAVEAAMAFVDVVRAEELSRLNVCAHPDCGNVLVDLSKNRSKRFCDAGCGNRAAVSAYRARKAGR
jgi:predicted RNA-binding Zn ribbon-like protein